MYELHSQDVFIIEAMSTTFVSLNIMRRFAKKMEGYVFRRASLNPHNPENMADAFEEEMFDWFEEDRNRNFWQGVVSKNGESFFVSMVPDYFNTSCLRCHGDYRNAPVSLVERYGAKGGFRFKSGDMAAINSVAIPVSTSLARIRRDSVIVFLVILATSALILFLLNLLFSRLVISRLARVSSSLLKEGDSSDHEGQKSLSSYGEYDELDILRQSSKTLTRYVKTARKGSELQPNFIGNYALGTPLAGGTLSWLYTGQDSRDNTKVSIKLGFSEIMANPLYAACFHSELKIMRHLRHDCLLKVIEQQDDMLVLASIEGHDFAQWLETQKKGLPDQTLTIILVQQICDLVATLHSDGVVHHDLRPGNFLITHDSQLKLIDMGLASWREIPDTILSSGLGPQGDFRYMAPEQIQGLRGDSRSDIYTIGILLYLLCTGQHPFQKRRSSLKKWLRMKESIEPPRTYKADLSDEVEAVILKATAWDMDSRYQWIEDLWEDFIKTSQ
jgi:serine/threonine protein kinase